MKLIERFLKYVSFDTQSSETSGMHPSSAGQIVLAKALADDLMALGARDVFVSETAYVYATIPASAGREEEPALGFLAHMDTAPDASGANVKPRRVVYSGGVLALGDSGRALDPEVFPELKRLVGEELIVTDGTTLLGADDKIGLAVLMTLAETLLKDDAPRHREIRICFTPDEEIGEGVDGFEPTRFGARAAYTVDGGPVDEVENANFNAASATIVFRGVSVHPGSAKDVMVNALKLATEVIAALPPNEAPETTEGREGFYHPTDLAGSVSEATVKFILRDHAADGLRRRKDRLAEIVAAINARHGEGTATLTIKDQYRNMEDELAKFPALIAAAEEAVRSVGLEPKRVAIRGGTDGARLTTEFGIACPNLGTGGRNYHGECEYAIVSEVEKAYRIVLTLATEAPDRGETDGR